MKTEINIYILFGILIIHWLGDFVLQTDFQAKNKSRSNVALTEHVANYSIVWFVVGMLWYLRVHNIALFCWFPIITFICHWVTDYFTSRLNTKLYNDGRTHEFFVSVGFDQILHYLQLVLTFQLLS